MEHAGHALNSETVFHPYLVHFPVAFFFLEALLILFWCWKKEDQYETFAFFTLKLAMIAMPFVMLAGYIDAGGIPSKVRTHFISAGSLLLLNGFRLFFRIKDGGNIWRDSQKGLSFGLLLASVILTSITAHLGGDLVYE